MEGDKRKSGKVDTERCFKLPFVGHFSGLLKRKLQEISIQFCKNPPQFRLVFTSTKIGSFFSLKDLIPKDELSMYVYHFACAGCNASYVGETTRNYYVRTVEHLESDKGSTVYKHLQKNRRCKRACSTDCFSMLDRATTPYQLKIKEAMHIAIEKPTLNIQTKSIKVTMVM